MTPIERLQAAIEKLEQFKTLTTPGPWEVDTNHPFSSDLVGIFSEQVRGYAVMFDHNETPTHADAELIVTLHRTIDAQLSLLRHAEKFLSTVGHHTSNIAGPFIDDALNLADAILATPALAERD